MKKIRIIAFLAIIFIMSTVLNVYAADYADSPTLEPDQSSSGGEVIFTPSTTTAKIGDTFTITVIAKCEDGIEGFDSILTWDQNNLQLTNQEEITEATGGLSEFIGETEEEFALVKIASSSTKDELKVATLNFKVLDSAEVDEKLLVSLSNIELQDSNEKVIALADKNVEVTVVAEPAPEPEPEPQPEQQQPEQQQPDKQQQDNTIADKTINKAGLSNYAFVIVLGAIVAVVLYAKCKKYKDIK